MSARHVVAVTFALTLVVALFATGVVGGRSSGNPFESKLPLVDPNSAAIAAARQATAADREDLSELAAVPTAVWLTPEAGTGQVVRDRVNGLVDLARLQGTVAVFAVYGIGQRDCSGGHSAGGLDTTAYRTWIADISTAINGAVVVLEPDALATADECDLVGERVALLADAAATLDEAGATVYIDAGHSGWTAPDRMAHLISSVGTDHLRGFSTNIANYQFDAAEVAYGEAIRQRIGGMRQIIDTGRNGRGPAADNDFCNPPDRAVGRRPSAGDAGIDAWLWIKPPGESDGECHGGPTAGQFWVEGALSLIRGQ